MGDPKEPCMQSYVDRFFVRSKKTVNEAKLKFGYFDYIQFWMETFLKSISQIRGIKKISNLPKKSLN